MILTKSRPHHITVLILVLFITCFRRSTVKEIDKDQAESADDSVVTKVTQAINGGDIGLSQRKVMTNNAKGKLNDKY